MTPAPSFARWVLVGEVVGGWGGKREGEVGEVGGWWEGAVVVVGMGGGCGGGGWGWGGVGWGFNVEPTP